MKENKTTREKDKYLLSTVTQNQTIPTRGGGQREENVFEKPIRINITEL